MSFINSSHKRIAKVSSDSVTLGFDLLSSLTYMSVLVIGNLPRDRVLELCSRQSNKTSIYFDYIFRLAKRLGMEYTRAFQIVSDRARAVNVKSLLLRFAASISSGEAEQDFILQETKAEGSRYESEYDRSVENLKKWTEAYAAILVSVTLIMVVSLVSTVLGSIEQSFVMIMAFALFFITSIGVYIINKSAPVEDVNYDPPKGPIDTRRKARLWLFILAPAGALLAFILAPQHGLMTGSAIAFTLVGLSLLPTGFMAWRDSGRIRKLDSEFPTFLRSVGNVAGATGFTITQALTKIDTRSMGTLKTYISRLNIRLGARVPVRNCWDRFRDETGSELVNRTSHMLLDGTELGGPPDRVGQICSEYAQSVVQLRAKRRLTSSSFSFLVFPMHATTTFILIFVLNIIAGFNERLQFASDSSLNRAQGMEFGSLPAGDAGIALSSPSGGIATGVDVFAGQDMSSIAFIIVLVILILTIANSLAPKFASGGSHLKIITYLSLMCLISGFVLGVVPPIISAIFA